MSAWTPARAAEALRLWNVEGRSATEIAAAVALIEPGLPGPSRNAVIGKLVRLGAPKRSEQVIAVTVATRSRRAGAMRREAATRPLKSSSPTLAFPTVSATPRREGVLLPLRDVSADSRDLPLSKLVETSCRYPVTGPGTLRPRLDGADTLFCGAAAADLHCPYCPAHRSLAWGKAAA